jgi:dipeptidase D
MILENFKTITKIERCSQNTEKMMDFLIEYSKKLGFNVDIDKAGNVLAYKDNSKICFQSHYDMVCIGEYENIEIIEKDGFLKAKSSTLGADNGIGIAMMMELMKSYKNCEYLFTNDEEIGLIGANNLELEIKSKNFINLDSEDEHIYLGCAGGFDVEINFSNEIEEVEGDVLKIEIPTQLGGHSGVDIDKDIKNAIKLLGKELSSEVKIVEIKGGERRNSIPVNAYAYVLDTHKSNKKIKVLKDSKKIIEFIKSFPTGVRGYDKEYDVVNRSINLSIIENNKIILSARGNSNEILEELMDELKSLFSMINVEYKMTDYYPAWKPKKSNLVTKYQKLTNQNIKVIHAGLECAILENRINADMISVGPNIYEPHSIRERVEINSIYKTYENIEKIIKEL